MRIDEIHNAILFVSVHISFYRGEFKNTESIIILMEFFRSKHEIYEYDKVNPRNVGKPWYFSWEWKAKGMEAMRLREKLPVWEWANGLCLCCMLEISLPRSTLIGLLTCKLIRKQKQSWYRYRPTKELVKHQTITWKETNSKLN